ERPPQHPRQCGATRPGPHQDERRDHARRQPRGRAAPRRHGADEPGGAAVRARGGDPLALHGWVVVCHRPCARRRWRHDDPPRTLGVVMSDPRVALIAGGSGAIGGTTAERLAREGYDVALVYRSNTDAAEAYADEVRAAGQTARLYRAALEEYDQ